jgi:hypothetical protein
MILLIIERIEVFLGDMTNGIDHHGFRPDDEQHSVRLSSASAEQHFAELIRECDRFASQWKSVRILSQSPERCIQTRVPTL